MVGEVEAGTHGSEERIREGAMQRTENGNTLKKTEEEGLSCSGRKKNGAGKDGGRERERNTDRQTHRGKRHRDKDTPHPSSVTPSLTRMDSASQEDQAKRGLGQKSCFRDPKG